MTEETPGCAQIMEKSGYAEDQLNAPEPEITDEQWDQLKADGPKPPGPLTPATEDGFAPAALSTPKVQAEPLMWLYTAPLMADRHFKKRWDNAGGDWTETPLYASALQSEPDELLREVAACRYPVCTTINPSGRDYDHGRLDQILAHLEAGGEHE